MQDVPKALSVKQMESVSKKISFVKHSQTRIVPQASFASAKDNVRLLVAFVLPVNAKEQTSVNDEDSAHLKKTSAFPPKKTIVKTAKIAQKKGCVPSKRTDV